MATIHNPLVRPMREREIVLARHAETELNIQKRLRGRADPPLSARGAMQADALAAWFDGQPPTVLLTSPRRRARDTTSAIARRHGLTASVDPRLDDVDYGTWTGHDERELRAGWPALYEHYMRDPDGLTFPGGEALAAVQARAWAIVSELAASGRPDRVVLVTHDAIMRLIVCRLLDAPLATMHDLSFELASTTGLIVRDTVLGIEWLNAGPDPARLH